MEHHYDLIYNLPHKFCRCRDEHNQLNHISRIYKEFFDKLKEGKTAVEVLNEMNIKKMCCRTRFLTIPIEHMIDRSQGRYFNHEKRNPVTYGTRELKPSLEAPEFPALLTS